MIWRCPPTTLPAPILPPLTRGYEAFLALNNLSKERTVREGGGAEAGLRGTPHPFVGEEARILPWTPVIILAGIPGPAEELSHSRGQSGEWTGDPALPLSTLQSKKRLRGTFSENRHGCSCRGAARGLSPHQMGDTGRWTGPASSFRLAQGGQRRLILGSPVLGVERRQFVVPSAPFLPSTNAATPCWL